MCGKMPVPKREPTHNLVDNLNTNDQGGNGGSLLEDISQWKEKNASISEAIVKADRHSPHEKNNVKIHIEHLQKITTEHFEKSKHSDSKNDTIKQCCKDSKLRTVDGIPVSKD